MSEDRDWISVAEAARRLGTSGTVVRRLIKREQLSVRAIPGTHPRVPSTELSRLVARHTHPAQRQAS
jgi:excisionase family DNA binding protein